MVWRGVKTASAGKGMLKRPASPFRGYSRRSASWAARQIALRLERQYAALDALKPQTTYTPSRLLTRPACDGCVVNDGLQSSFGPAVI